jgi:hypothetical protein
MIIIIFNCEIGSSLTNMYQTVPKVNIGDYQLQMSLKLMFIDPHVPRQIPCCRFEMFINTSLRGIRSWLKSISGG